MNLNANLKRPWQALLVALFLSFSLISCSKVDWAVRFADTYFAWKISSQFELSGEAKTTVKEESRDFVKSLRQKQVPALSQSFSQSAEEIKTLNFASENAVRNWLENKFSTAESLLNSAWKDSHPRLLRIAGKLDQSNWDRFLKNFEKDNEKILNKKDRCEKKMEDGLESWMGSLNATQKNHIDSYCEARGDIRESRVQNRKTNLANFQKLLNLPESSRAATPNLFAVTAKTWLEEKESITQFDTQNTMKQRKELLLSTFTKILLDSSQEQRSELGSTLQNRARKLEALSL